MVGIEGGTYYADRQKEKRNAEVAAGDAGETKRQKARMDADTSSGRARGDVVGDGDRGSVSDSELKRQGARMNMPTGKDTDRVPTTPKPQAKAKSRLPGPPAPKPSTGATREYPKSESSIFGRLFARDDERDRLLTERNTGSYAKGGKVKC